MGFYQLPQSAAQVQQDLELIEHLQGPFDPLKTYVKGDLVTHEGFLWRCRKNVTEKGDWTGTTNWMKITLKELLDLKQDVLSATTVTEGHVQEVIGFNEKNELVHERPTFNPCVEDETLKF